ncbi:hypothetical protein E2562_012801 [Oryza meyeriana var. granulata]|uniref:F-box domain-containing protein n=1 Tax=Oryza meyeriana var. granulata TaxID=110450 RepID=A0A6G1DHN3_9ORYZ|nr:hypothetical protein E2562_012801 [Oryza meyeriana var. granulata]
MTGAQHLPDELIQEILLRLPPRTIGRCLAVCKAWCSLVSAPIFHRASADRPAAVAKVTSTWASFHGGAGDGDGLPGSFFHKVMLFDSYRCRWVRGNVHKTPPSPRGIKLSSPRNLATTIVGSWDGVVCIDRGLLPDADRHRQYVLWNPLTRACATVSPPPGRGVIIGAYAHPATMRFHLLHAAC